MLLTLTPIEARVLGALIEKEITTPEYYPLSLNALTNACNQKSNRDPVIHLEESEVRKALNHLEYQSLVRSVSSTDSRVTKFEHRLQDAFNFYRPEVAIVCELLLRGPRTANARFAHARFCRSGKRTFRSEPSGKARTASGDGSAAATRHEGSALRASSGRCAASCTCTSRVRNWSTRR
jgi:Protein of unknown function, DUF480